jgi:hypothetical protein
VVCEPIVSSVHGAVNGVQVVCSGVRGDCGVVQGAVRCVQEVVSRVHGSANRCMALQAIYG